MREVRVMICTVIGPSKMPNSIIKVEKIKPIGYSLLLPVQTLQQSWVRSQHPGG
jgi:hypothetical protein